MFAKITMDGTGTTSKMVDVLGALLTTIWDTSNLTGVVPKSDSPLAGLGALLASCEIYVDSGAAGAGQCAYHATDNPYGWQLHDSGNYISSNNAKILKSALSADYGHDGSIYAFLAIGHNASSEVRLYTFRNWNATTHTGDGGGVYFPSTFTPTGTFYVFACNNLVILYNGGTSASSCVFQVAGKHTRQATWDIQSTQTTGYPCTFVGTNFYTTTSGAQAFKTLARAKATAGADPATNTMIAALQDIFGNIYTTRTGHYGRSSNGSGDYYHIFPLKLVSGITNTNNAYFAGEITLTNDGTTVLADAWSFSTQLQGVGSTLDTFTYNGATYVLFGFLNAGASMNAIAVRRG